MKKLCLLLAMVFLARTVGSAQPPAATNRALPLGDKELAIPLPGGAKTELVHIQPGEFLMGASACERARRDRGCELPQRHFKITHDFYLGKYECTVGEFRAFVEETGFQTNHEKEELKQPGLYGGVTWQHPGDKDEHGGGLGNGSKAYTQTDRHPVVMVCRADIKVFAKWLTDKYAPEGWEFRLPTDAEWEYACRAGTTTAYNCGDWLTPENANIGESKIMHPVPVGSYPPNPWGLYDMHGNVYEFALDTIRSEFNLEFAPLENPVIDAPIYFDVCPYGETVLNFADYRSVPEREGDWYGYSYQGAPMRGGCYWELAPAGGLCRSAARRADGSSAFMRGKWLGFRIALCRTNSLNLLSQTTEAGLTPKTPKGFSLEHPPKAVTVELEGGAWFGKHRFSAEQVNQLRLHVHGAKTDMVWIAPGEFTMGPTPGSTAAPNGKGQHPVKIAKGFYIGKYEISRGEYRAFIKGYYMSKCQVVQLIYADWRFVRKGPTDQENNLMKATFPYAKYEFELNTWQNPGFKQGENEPVVCVSWDDTQDFVQWCNEHHAPAGWKFRLPTEAEWEYACRAGTDSTFSFGNDLKPEQANMGGIKKKTAPVGSYAANAWGLYDMHGNVAEWVEDSYTADSNKDNGVSHVVRGGSWNDPAGVCGSASRTGQSADFRSNTVGFRVVLAPDPASVAPAVEKTVAPAKSPAALVMDSQSLRAKFLNDLHLVFRPEKDAVAAIQKNAGVAIVDATADNLAALAQKSDAVEGFTKKGGWLVLWGVTPEGLASFNKIVGVEHLLRPFRRESVEFLQPEDPLLETGKVAGPYKLRPDDVVLAGGTTVPKGAAEYYGSSDTFTYIVDYDDVAPFCKIPDWKYFYPDRQKPSFDNDPISLVDGFTLADDRSYCLVLYTKTSKLEFDLELPRVETPVQLEIAPSTVGHILTKIELTYDGDTQNVQVLNLNPKAGDQKQILKLSPRQAKVIHVKFAGWQDKKDATKQNPEGAIGVENIWLRVERSAGFREKVKPFFTIGGLVKYPRGKGGIILCQLQIPAEEIVMPPRLHNQTNREKREAIIGALLDNLGAPFDPPVIIGE